MNFDVFLPPAAHRSTLPVCVKSACLLQRRFDLLSIKNSISCSHKYPKITPVGRFCTVKMSDGSEGLLTFTAMIQMIYSFISYLVQCPHSHLVPDAHAVRSCFCSLYLFAASVVVGDSNSELSDELRCLNYCTSSCVSDILFLSLHSTHQKQRQLQILLNI